MVPNTQKNNSPNFFHCYVKNIKYENKISVLKKCTQNGSGTPCSDKVQILYYIYFTLSLLFNFSNFNFIFSITEMWCRFFNVIIFPIMLCCFFKGIIVCKTAAKLLFDFGTISQIAQVDLSFICSQEWNCSSNIAATLQVL